MYVLYQIIVAGFGGFICVCVCVFVVVGIHSVPGPKKEKQANEKNWQPGVSEMLTQCKASCFVATAAWRGLLRAASSSNRHHGLLWPFPGEQKKRVNERTRRGRIGPWHHRKPLSVFALALKHLKTTLWPSFRPRGLPVLFIIVKFTLTHSWTSWLAGWLASRLVVVPGVPGCSVGCQARARAHHNSTTEPPRDRFGAASLSQPCQQRNKTTHPPTGHPLSPLAQRGVYE